jgi:hypothetical protein
MEAPFKEELWVICYRYLHPNFKAVVKVSSPMAGICVDPCPALRNIF